MESIVMMKIFVIIGYLIGMAITAGTIGGVSDNHITFDFFRIFFWPITLFLFVAFLFLGFWYKVGTWIRDMLVN